MVFKQIKYKIGIIIFTAFLCGLGALMALTHWSIKKQFLNYTAERTTDSLIPLESRISRTYLEDGNLERYRGAPDLWKRTTERLIRANIRKYRQNQPPTINEPLRTNAPRKDTNNKNTNQNKVRASTQRAIATPWELRLRQNQRIFLRNLGLYDTNYERIAGTQSPPSSQKFYPIVFNNVNIAYIGYSEPREFTRDSEFIFWNQQIKSFWVLSILMFFVSLIAASFIAKKISNPLSELRDATNKLADGDKVDPILSTSEDEIGQLCRAFNTMSHQLANNEAARKRWAADISHEMRTPLAVLKAQIEAMEDGIRPANKESLALLSNKVNGISHLINDLYELSLYDSNALRYNKTVFSIADHIESFVTDNQCIFIKKNLTFNFNTQENKHFRAKKALVFADEHRIDQLLNNVMQNSLRYTNGPGHIEWLTGCDEKNIIITMRDSAPGLDAKHLEVIFDRLYRAEVSRNKETGGAGLGLSICKSIVLAHEGKIWAEPSRLGGVQIKITLPKHIENNKT